MDIFFLVLEYIGIVAFSVSGAMVAIDKEADYIGIVLMSLVTGFAGGIMRDLFLGSTPPRFFTSYQYSIIVCVLTSVLVIVLATVFKRGFVRNEEKVNTVNNFIDAIGIGIFAVGGTKIAVELGFTSPLIAISMGVISSVGGGLVRDLILREIPFIIKKRIYALATLAGASVYYILAVKLSVDTVLATCVGVLLTFMLRVLATVFKWNIPKAIDFARLEEEVQDGDSHPK